MKQYKWINRLVGFIIFGISLWQYTSTMESSGSLWDCGEFISCCYKLQVAHPPGAPLFMMVGRIFTLFASDPSHVAQMVNLMSAMSSALCVMFLFWIITILSRKLIAPKDEDLTTDRIISIMGAGIVGALACSFMDSMWFSATEGEVYASSMFFISIVLWGIMKWDEHADEPHGNRWLVFSAYMIGLSIGVHLLSLLVIPAGVLIYYYKKFKPTAIGFVFAFFVGFVLLAIVQVGVIQIATKLAGYVEHFAVNVIRLPFNSGLLIAYTLLFGGLIYAMYFAARIKHPDMQLAATCMLVIFVGFSSYLMVPIRAKSNPPINMNNPRDSYSLLSYLNREQYGDRPLLKGPLFNAQPYDYDMQGKVYYPDLKTKRYEVKGEKIGYKYKPEDEMLFPRMGPTNDGDAAGSFYQYWTGYQGTPTFADNLNYFFKYQLGYMYWRYFMWNFSGRQDDYQGMPGTQKMNGDWLSGISILDDARLGSQEGLPDQIKNQKARNIYYMIPLLLGLIGFVFMYHKNNHYTIIFTLLFIGTGILLIVYSNQPPREPRERDYVLVGSFYTFCIWIGMAVLAFSEFVRERMKNLAIPAAVAATLICLSAPYLMGSAAWDDHNRNGRYMARDFAANYLHSCPPNAILFTQGDNDTYPLWYAQEVEGIRTDVRIVNLSLLGVDWYIDFLQTAANKSGPVPFFKEFTPEKYRGNKRDIVQLNDQSGLTDPNKYYELSSIMAFALSDDPQYQAQSNRGDMMNFLPTTKFSMKVDRAAVEKYQVVPDQFKDKIVDEIQWDLGKTRIIKYDLAVLALLAGADWSRPICFANTVDADYYNGIDKYLLQEGEVLRFVPCRFEENGKGYFAMNTQRSYDLVMKSFKYGGIGEREMFVDENSGRIMNTLKSVHFAIADDLVRNGKNQEAVNILDKVKKEFRYENAPYYTPTNRFFNIMTVQWIDLYYRAGAPEKSKVVIDLFIKDLKDCLRFYNLPNSFAARYANEKKSAEEFVKRMEYLAISYQDAALMKQLHEAFPALVQSAVITPESQAPMQVFR
jgi:Protein of unknown function (DUF2723)